MTTVKVGYDRRCWATFEVKDATADELATLQRAFETGTDADTDAARVVLTTLRSTDRLTLMREDMDPFPDYFAGYTDPSVVDFEQEEA